MSKPPASRSRRLVGWFAGLVVLLAIAGALAWPTIRRARTVAGGLPPQPEPARVSSALAAELNDAELAARGWRAPVGQMQRLAELYHANGFPTEAKACYLVLTTLQPREPRWPYLLAQLEASSGNVNDALPWQQRAAALGPNEFMVQLRLGDLLFKNNSLPDAEKAYREAVRISPGDSYALLGLARCALRRDDWNGARTFLRQAVDARSNFVGAWALLASVEQHLGNTAAAADARRRGNGQFRELSDPWLSFLTARSFDPYQLSIAAAVSPNPAEARELLERAVTLAPNSSSYRRQLAKVLITAGQTAEARAQLEKAVALEPTDVEAWSTLITLLMDLKEGRAAVAALAEALRHCPQSGFLHFTNGRRLAATGHPAEAEGEFQISKQLQPSEIRAYVELSTLYVQQEKFPEALREVQSALQVDPSNALLVSMIAQLYVMSGNETQAITWAQRYQQLPNPERETSRQIESMYQQQFGRALKY